MSELKTTDLYQVQIWYTPDEKIGEFQLLDCEEHGTQLSFTDKSGADYCMACMEDKVQSLLPPKYKLPDYDTVIAGLNSLTNQPNQDKE